MSKQSFSGGFSLVELIVVVAIFLTITGVVLINQNRFSSNSSIQNLAYEMALSIRSAQVYGISVRGSMPNSNATFDTAFGLHFDCSTPGSYVFFADVNKDGVYSNNTQAEGDQARNLDIERSVFTLDNKNKILDIITSGGGNTFSCPDVGTADITFRRPRPEAIIKDPLHGAEQASQIEIVVISALKDLKQKIFVTASGQIYVTN